MLLFLLIYVLHPETLRKPNTHRSLSSLRHLHVGSRHGDLRPRRQGGRTQEGGAGHRGGRIRGGPTVNNAGERSGKKDVAI